MRHPQPQPIYIIVLHAHDGNHACGLYTPDDLAMFWRLASMMPPGTWSLLP